MDKLTDDDFVTSAEAVSGRADFAAFVWNLLRNFRSHPEAWENNELESFLHGLARFVESVDGYYRFWSVPVDAEEPTWRNFAEILVGARVCDSE
jgi:hypothetical protein